MYWAEHNGASSVPPDPEFDPLLPLASTKRRCRSRPASRSPAQASPSRSAITMPIDAKAGCLYPNNARALMEARSRGFDNCLLCDMLGNVAELATANIFMAKDGVVMTPMANGTFLNGVTRQRVLQLLRGDGKDAREATLELCRFRRGGRDFRRRQFRQGDAGPAHRRTGPAAGPLLSPRARALLGICPFSISAPDQTQGGDMTTRLTIRLDFDGRPPARRRQGRASRIDRQDRVDLGRRTRAGNVVPPRLAAGR